MVKRSQCSTKGHPSQPIVICVILKNLLAFFPRNTLSNTKNVSDFLWSGGLKETNIFQMIRCQKTSLS